MSVSTQFPFDRLVYDFILLYFMYICMYVCVFLQSFLKLAFVIQLSIEFIHTHIDLHTCVLTICTKN